jgi:hypothetical protein
MVGVCMEPVIAQLMMILLAIDVSSLSEQCRAAADSECRCQGGVISRLCHAGHHYREPTECPGWAPACASLRKRVEIRPWNGTEAHGPEYFIHRLRFTHDVAPIFGPYLFAPAIRTVYYLAQKLRALQSGHLNFYLALIGGLLVIILALTLP